MQNIEVSRLNYDMDYIPGEHQQNMPEWDWNSPPILLYAVLNDDGGAHGLDRTLLTVN